MVSIGILFLIIMLETLISNLLPNVPAGCVFAKSCVVNLFLAATVKAKASDIANAHIILDDGAKLFGQASRVTDASRAKSEDFANLDDICPVMEIILHFKTLREGRSLIIS